MSATVAPILPLHIDSTMMSCFRSCPQKYYNEFILGLRPARLSVDLHFGACFSSTLEHFYRMVWERGVDPRTALDRCLIFLEHQWGTFDPPEGHAKTKANCYAALESYISTYPPLTDHIRPLVSGGRTSFEFTFALPLDDGNFPRHPSGDPFIYVGRADLLGLYRSAPCIRDEKTTSRLDSRWSEHWNLRSQFLGYLWAARKGGIAGINTVAVRGVVVTKTQIRQVEAIKVYSDMLISRWYEQLRRDLWRLTEMWGSHRSLGNVSFDYNLGETCTSYGLCPFMDLCQSPSPDRWMTNYEVVRWNPLLRNPIDETTAAISTSPSLLPESATPFAASVS